MFNVLQVFLLLFTVIAQESHGQQILNRQVEMNTTVYLPCSCSVSPDRTSSVLWYRSRNRDIFIEDGRAIAWRGGGLTGNSPGYGINDDFSMVIHRVELSNQGLYRCIVTPVGGDARSTCDVTLDVYANPYSFPLIKYSSQANDINVTCSISRVFPPTFPKLTSHAGIGTTETNEDGTYNTSVSHLFPLSNNDTQIQCHYSNTNFRGMSSLVITDRAGQPAIGDQELRNGSVINTDSNLNTRCTLSGLWMLWVKLPLEILIFVIMVCSVGTDIKSTVHKTTKESSNDETSDEKETFEMESGQPVNGRGNGNVEILVNAIRFLFGGKCYLLAIKLTMLAIQVSVIILSSTYLATNSVKRHE